MHKVDRQFVTGGHAIFTVANGKGLHYTYQVTRKDPEAGSRYEAFGPTYFVALLTGPNNDSDYTYMGLLEAATGKVRLTKASKFGANTVPVKVACWALGKVWAGQAFPEGYTLHHEGKCARCGRTLTTPESVERGFGPECWGKVAA